LRNKPGSAPLIGAELKSKIRRSQKVATAPHPEEERIRGGGRTVGRSVACIPSTSRKIAAAAQRRCDPNGGGEGHQIARLLAPLARSGSSFSRTCVDTKPSCQPAILLAESLAQERRSDGSAVEQDGINARAIVEEFGKVSGLSRCRQDKEPPFPQCQRASVRPRRRVTEGEKIRPGIGSRFPPHHQSTACERADHPDPRPASGNNEPLIRRPRSGQARALSDDGRRRRVIPLRAGKPAARPGKPRLQKMGDGKVDIVAAEQRMVAHRDTPMSGSPFARSCELQNAEIRGCRRRYR